MVHSSLGRSVDCSGFKSQPRHPIFKNDYPCSFLCVVQGAVGMSDAQLDVKVKSLEAERQQRIQVRENYMSVTENMYSLGYIGIHSLDTLPVYGAASAIGFRS